MAGIEVYIWGGWFWKSYDCVVFVSSVIFLFFIYVVRVCLSFLSWGGVWVRWGCRERECGNRRRVSVRVTGGRVFWRTRGEFGGVVNEWPPLHLSLAQERIRKDLVQRLKKKGPKRGTQTQRWEIWPSSTRHSSSTLTCTALSDRFGPLLLEKNQKISSSCSSPFCFLKNQLWRLIQIH